MHCAICGNTVDKEHPFTDPKSHKLDCPVFVGDEVLANVIRQEVEKADKE